MFECFTVISGISSTTFFFFLFSVEYIFLLYEWKRENKFLGHKDVRRKIS